MIDVVRKLNVGEMLLGKFVGLVVNYFRFFMVIGKVLFYSF